MTPEHEPTADGRALVSLLAGFGISEDDIARQIGISNPTLRKYYFDELANGHVRANIRVTRRLWDIAVSKDKQSLAACIFWLKCRAGWSEYAPPPSSKPAPLGKKEVAEQDAMTAAHDTGWDHLVH